MKTPGTIGERLKAAREALGLSQGEVAAAAGVRQGTIGNIESNARKNPRELLAIAKAVGVSPDWLKSGDAPAPSPAPTAQSTVGGAVALIANAMAALPVSRRRTIAQLAAEQFTDGGDTDIEAQIDALAPGVRVMLPSGPAAQEWRDNAFRLAETNPDDADRDRLTRFIREVDLFIAESKRATSVTPVTAARKAAHGYLSEG